MVESRHKRMIDIGLNLIFRANLRKSFWTFVFRVAMYVLNRVPSKVIEFQSPYFVLYTRDLDYHIIKFCGSLCFSCLRPYRTNKLDAKHFPWLCP